MPLYFSQNFKEIDRFLVTTKYHFKYWISSTNFNSFISFNNTDNKIDNLFIIDLFNFLHFIYYYSCIEKL